MKTLRPVIAILMSLTLLFGFVPSAFAGNATHYSVRVKNVNIPWAYPEGLSSNCSQITEGTFINPDDQSSSRVKNVTVNDLGGGMKKILWTDLVKGTATDNFGMPYTFVYENNATFVFDGSFVTVDMKDTFVLKGNINYTVGFQWRWVYPTDSLNLVFVESDGQVIDIFPTPIIGPTPDGINPDPNIVPGSWQILSSRGDPNPLSCDPL